MVASVVLRQLARATFSVGANLEESAGAQTRADFAAKVAIAAKEAREAQFWLRLAAESGVLNAEEHTMLAGESREIAVVVSTIARRARMPACD